MATRSLCLIAPVLIFFASATGSARAQQTTPVADPSAPPAPVITETQSGVPPAAVVPPASTQPNAAPVAAGEPTEAPTSEESIVTPIPASKTVPSAEVASSNARQIEKKRSRPAAPKAAAKQEPSAPSPSQPSGDQAAAAQAAATAATADNGSGGTPPSGAAPDNAAAAIDSHPAPVAAPDSSPSESAASPASSDARGMSASGWILAAIALAGLIFIIAMMSRRRREDRLSILGRGVSSEVRTPLAGRRLS